jgi:hydrogenase maturation protease
MNMDQILVLGVGNILLSDEGFGVRVVNRLKDSYVFPENVCLMDGGVLGMNLLGPISEASHLIVIDAIRNRHPAGTRYRIEGRDIPARIRSKNSLHQIDLLEALTLCEALGNVPETVILGVEPRDIETMDIHLTPEIAAQVEPMVECVLKELAALNVSWQETPGTYPQDGPSPSCCRGGFTW